jgi:hypothetical protein
LSARGGESYPSKDKAILFFETPRLNEAVLEIGKENLVHSESSWAVLHDPEGHNIVLFKANDQSGRYKGNRSILAKIW